MSKQEPGVARDGYWRRNRQPAWIRLSKFQKGSRRPLGLKGASGPPSSSPTKLTLASNSPILPSSSSSTPTQGGPSTGQMPGRQLTRPDQKHTSHLVAATIQLFFPVCLYLHHIILAIPQFGHHSPSCTFLTVCSCSIALQRPVPSR